MRNARVPRIRGIIPARAGFTLSSAGETSGARDHPRSRGVYTPRNRASRARAGSSPLARGLRVSRRLVRVLVGIIPARAGFTLGGGAFPLPCGDHPRSRGVYPRPHCTAPAAPGSSPLARGLRASKCPCRRRTRIIPARAGFTRDSTVASGTPRDHPRSRGVYCVIGAGVASVAGSSPFARGLQHVSRERARRSGIIPARAGFTSSQSSRGKRVGDHPRSRGVYFRSHSIFFGTIGSSPLARGLPGWT